MCGKDMWSGLALSGNDLVIGRLELVAGDHVIVEDDDADEWWCPPTRSWQS
jgi:hypothetical protein